MIGDEMTNRPVGERKYEPSNVAIKITLLLLLIATVYAFTQFNAKGVKYGAAAIETLKNVRTIFASVIAFFLGIFAASNLSNNIVSSIVRAFVAFIRAVPTVLWVLIFAVSAGLGTEAAVIGLSFPFHAIGYLTKAYSEVFEEMDKGLIEALKSTGAGFWQIIFRAVVPSTATYLIAWTFMRFEINYMTAIAMGAAAGAGGIGFDLFMAGSFYFDTREVGALSVLILIKVFLLEMISIRLKRYLNADFDK